MRLANIRPRLSPSFCSFASHAMHTCRDSFWFIPLSRETRQYAFPTFSSSFFLVLVLLVLPLELPMNQKGCREYGGILITANLCEL